MAHIDNLHRFIHRYRIIPKPNRRRNAQLHAVAFPHQRLRIANAAAANQRRIAIEHRMRVEQVADFRAVELELVRAGEHGQGEIVRFFDDGDEVGPDFWVVALHEGREEAEESRCVLVFTLVVEVCEEGFVADAVDLAAHGFVEEGTDRGGGVCDAICHSILLRGRANLW